MVNYQNGKIYKIESNLGDKIYIGSTTKNYLSQRIDSHRSQYKQWKSNKRGLTTSFLLFEEYGLENCKIILLEAFPCSSKDELIARESHYIKTIDCVNKVIPDRTKQEYYETNKDNFKEYYQINKDNIKKRTDKNKEKLFEKIICECGGHFIYKHKSTHLKTKIHLKYLEVKEQSLMQ
jgi:hypothetical protein